MPDFDPKLAASLKNLHLDPKVTNNTPDLHVTPVPQRGGPTPDQFTAIQQAITALQSANATLTSRVAELEKQMVAVRLVMQGIDPAFNAVKQQIADFRTEYSTHSHDLPFNYESFTFLQETGDNNKPNFLMAYVWEGGNRGANDFQRQQHAQALGSRTAPPTKQAPK